VLGWGVQKGGVPGGEGAGGRQGGPLLPPIAQQAPAVVRAQRLGGEGAGGGVGLRGAPERPGGFGAAGELATLGGVGEAHGPAGTGVHLPCTSRKERICMVSDRGLSVALIPPAPPYPFPFSVVLVLIAPSVVTKGTESQGSDRLRTYKQVVDRIDIATWQEDGHANASKYDRKQRCGTHVKLSSAD